MNLWSVISVILLTLGLNPSQLSYLSTVELSNQGPQQTANIQRIVVEDKNVVPQRKNSGSLGVKITAPSAAVMDLGSGIVLWQKSAKEARSIASISKLMTALVFLENNPGWNNVVTLKESDEAGANIPNILRDQTVTVKDLFYTTLVASDNNTANALVRSTNLSQAEFVKLMNAKAQTMGLSNTYFVEPLGLDARNSSTALEVLAMAKVAFANPDIKSATAMKTYNFIGVNGEAHKVKSTNNLLNSFLNIKNGKTGSTDQAGYCLVLEVGGSANQNILTVVLGSATHEDRFKDAKILSAWTLENYSWL